MNVYLGRIIRRASTRLQIASSAFNGLLAGKEQAGRNPLTSTSDFGYAMPLAYAEAYSLMMASLREGIAGN